MACLGVSESDWETLGIEALNNLDLEVAKKSYMRIKDMPWLYLLDSMEVRHAGQLRYSLLCMTCHPSKTRCVLDNMSTIHVIRCVRLWWPPALFVRVLRLCVSVLPVSLSVLPVSVSVLPVSVSVFPVSVSVFPVSVSVFPVSVSVLPVSVSVFPVSVSVFPVSVSVFPVSVSVFPVYVSVFPVSNRPLCVSVARNARRRASLTSRCSWATSCRTAESSGRRQSATRRAASPHTRCRCTQTCACSTWLRSVTTSSGAGRPQTVCIRIKGVVLMGSAMVIFTYSRIPMMG